MRPQCLWAGRVSLIEIWIVNWDGLVNFLQREERHAAYLHRVKIVEMGKYNFQLMSDCPSVCMMYIWIAWSGFLLASDTHFCSCRFPFLEIQVSLQSQSRILHLQHGSWFSSGAEHDIIMEEEGMKLEVKYPENYQLRLSEHIQVDIYQRSRSHRSILPIIVKNLWI